ncbi:MAG TPA: AMP-binding protein, partial [bacterium]|nr:AMP-binding protein [bacterium]
MSSQDQSITSLQKDTLVFPPPAALSAKAYIGSPEKYKEMYDRSIRDSRAFWLEQASKELQWFQQPTKALEYTWDTKKRLIEHKWFEDGKLNVSVNCLDRHLRGPMKDKIAILWQGEKDEEVRKITYLELHQLVCRFSNVLLSKGLKKGDRVCIYMPMIPEAAVALLACARLGVIHSVVFAGFSAQSIRDRIQDSQNVAVITADVAFRAGRTIQLKNIVDEALKECPTVKSVVVFQRGDGEVTLQAGRDFWW